MNQIGSHVSISGGFHLAYERSANLGATSLQFFTKSPRGRTVPNIDFENLSKAREYKKKYNINGGMIHSSYLINLAKPYGEALKDRKSMLFDFQIGYELGINFINVHIGKTAQKYEYKQAINNMKDNVQAILDAAGEEGWWNKTKGPMFVFENTAGQGTEMGYKFEELGEILHAGLSDLPIGVCLDTCHLWAAGYDVGNWNQLSEKSTDTERLLSKNNNVILLEEFDKYVGIDRLVAVHLNDAKVPLGSKLDRHANHGYGFIGYNRLQNAIQWSGDNNILLIQETPEENRWAAEIDRIQRVQKGDTAWIENFDQNHLKSEILEKFKTE